MQLTLRKKIILLSISLLVIVTIASSIITNYDLQRYYKGKVFEQLAVHLDQIEYLLGNTDLVTSLDEKNYTQLKEFADQSDIRLTLIDSVGKVIFDSYVPRDSLFRIENHLYRPEVQQAMKYGIGSDQRTSATVDKPLFYVAKEFAGVENPSHFLHNVRFVRVAFPLQEIRSVLQAVRWKIFGGSGIALIIIALFSYWISNRITYPIKQLSQVAEQIKSGKMDAHFVHQAHDELGDLADLLNEMIAKLREDLIHMRKLEKMRSQFLGNVSHELRTPIFAVQGYLETLLELDQYDKQIVRKFVEKAYQQSSRLNNLLADLIDISRIESGEMQMSFDNFNVKKWLLKLVDDLQPTAQESKVTLDFVNRQDSNKTFVLGDQKRLGHVMTNLVNNAIKYNVPHGKVEIGFSELERHVEIFVQDSGRGIPAEHIPRIFERFYRVDQERSRAVGGTGLGLAIVKHIVEAHGSHVKVESKVGQGSAFSFKLRKTGF